MAMSKKGIFFTMVSIILVASLVFFYLSSNKYSLKDKTGVIRIRVMTMDSFIEDIEEDIRRGLYISSMRSLIGMGEFMTTAGLFLPDFEGSFNEVMLNGTVNGVVINITQNATFGNWTNKIIDIGKNLDICAEFQNLQIIPFQEDPWNVKVKAIGTLNLTDRKGLASWSRSLNVTATISIIDFEDPLYTVNSTGKTTNKIVRSNITNFVSGIDASNLILHANSSWYISSASAPSFLMRFAGNLSPSPYGIESIVNYDELPIELKKTSSSIDYIYFGNSSIANCRVNETRTDLSWLRLDNDHLAVYESHCES